MIIVIGVPNAVFLINKYQQEIKKHGQQAKALQRVIAKIGNEVAGFYEYLYHEEKNEVELTYMGIFREYFGRKLGGYLLTHALRSGWSHNPNRIWVHTCTLDHPNALKNYIARGMNIFKKESVKI